VSDRVRLAAGVPVQARQGSPVTPTLAELAQEPARVAEVPAEAVPSLLVQLAGVQAALAARLASCEPQNAPSGKQAAPGKMLIPGEAADLLGVKVTWLYRHAPKLPFTRRLSRKALRFSETGLHRWLAAQKTLRHCSAVVP